MFKRYEHRGHVLLQFIPLGIYKFCLFQFSPRLFGSPNVHSTLRSMNREGLIQLFEVQPCADPESYVRGGPTLTFLFS